MFLAKESGVDSHRMKHRDWDWPTLLLLLLIVIWHRCWHHRPELGESDQTVILSNHVDLVLFPPFLRIILNITEANPIRGCCMLSTKYFWTFHFLVRCQFCLRLDRIGKAFNFQESHFTQCSPYFLWSVNKKQKTNVWVCSTSVENRDANCKDIKGLCAVTILFVDGVIVRDGCWLAVLVAADASCSWCSRAGRESETGAHLAAPSHPPLITFPLTHIWHLSNAQVL